MKKILTSAPQDLGFVAHVRRTDEIRYWQSIPGVQIDDPHLLAQVVTEALADKHPWPQERLAAADRVFPHRDGLASQRGAQILAAHA